MKTFSDLFRAANQRLIDFNAGISLEQRGRRLYLRGTLPPKPKTNKTKPHQQNLALGVFANPDGLKFAEREAKKVGVLLACGEFEWTPYLGRRTQSREPESPEEAIANFKQHYFSTRKRTRTTEQTFKHEYLGVFGRLEKISIEEMRQLILDTEPDSRNRRRYALAFACLADFLGLENDFRPLVGKYRARAILPKDIPSDEGIADIYGSIPDADWRWAFALQACYGLRNHEIFYADVSRFPILQINEGKTGSRVVFPFYLEWAEKWCLHRSNHPNCSGDTNSDLGNRVTHAYKRLNVGFNPYALRHAWAVRSLKFGLHPTLAAQQMGHNPETHHRHYQNWIDVDIHASEFERVMAKGDRPLPP